MPAPIVRSRPAFTLLEVLLTLSLAVVLVSLVGGALQFYARDMNVRDMDIRQTQLATAVMQMIEDDLRSTLRTTPIDTAPLAELLASTASPGGAGGAAPTDATSDDLAAAGIESESTTETAPAVSDTSNSLDLQTGVAMLQAPGLIGNQYQIQIDLSRLPRLEEYVTLLDGTNTDIEDVPSDIKTVAYFVQDSNTIGGVQDPLQQLTGDSSGAATGGLVRRSLDRAATAYAASTGNLVTLNQTGELLAPEIKGIEFQYWDGLVWQLQWSSDEFGELPLAVQITLYMADPRVELDPN